MLGFVVVFAFLWVVWAVSPLSAPLVGAAGGAVEDMPVVLVVAGIAVVMAARIHRSQLFARRIGTRFGAVVAMALFALSVYPPFSFSADTLFSAPASASEWYLSIPVMIGGLLDAYSLQGLILAVASSAWITAMLLRQPRDA